VRERPLRGDFAK
jgi:hypothetical protein